MRKIFRKFPRFEFINLHKLDIKHCTGCIVCVKLLMSGRGRTCALKDDFLWLLDKMLDADGILMVSPIFENGVPGIVHTVCDRFGPSMDRGNLFIADMLSKEHGGPGVDPRLLQDKVISFMAVGGSDWGSLVQMDHGMVAMSLMWKIIDNDKFQWSKTILMDDDALARAHQIGINLANAAKDIDTMSGKMAHGKDIQENERRLADLQKNSEEFKARKAKYKALIQPTVPQKA